MIKREFWQPIPPVKPDGWEKLTDDIKSKNYWEGIEETKLLWGKDWSEIKMADFENSRWAFTFLPDEHLPYFVGAYMTASLHEGPDPNDFTEMFFLVDPTGMRRKVAKKTWVLNRMKIAPFNAGQRSVMAEYLRLLEHQHLEPESTYFRGFLLGEIREET